MTSELLEYWSGAVLWVYDGPATFHDSDTDVAGAEQGAVVLLEEIWHGVRVDSEGRRWVVGDVDLDALERQAVEYTSAVADDFGAVDSGVIDSSVELYEPGTGGAFVENAWLVLGCDGESPDGTSLWQEDDDRTPVVDFDSDEETAEAVVYFNFGSGSSPSWGPACSATFIDSSGSLLTAAHCVTDGADPIDPNFLKVCTYGNYDAASVCYGGTDLTVPADWTGSNAWTRAHDFAVIDTTLVAWSGYIPMGTQSDSWLESHAVTMIGYPGSVVRDSDQQCLGNAPSSTTDTTYPNPNLLRRDVGSVLNATSTVLRGQYDSGPGQSGGAIVAFSSGVPYHVGVHSGHDDALTDWSGGPKTAAIRTWVLANTP